MMDKFPTHHMSMPSEEKFTVSVKNIDAQVEKGKLYFAHVDTKNIHYVPIVLSLFANTTGKFPKPYEILMCNEETTWEEVQLMINRSILYSQVDDLYNLYAIVGIEKLDHEIQNKLVTTLHEIVRLETKNYLLALLCRSHELHPILVEFSKYVHKTPGLNNEALSRCFQTACPSVYMITSDVPGLGKTEDIMQKASMKGKNVQSIQISGPVNKQSLTELIIAVCSEKKNNHVLHIDIGSIDDPHLLDSFLFELVVLKCVVSGTSIAHLHNKEVSIEVANTLRQQLRDDLFMMSCFERVHIEWQSFENLIVSENVNSPVQIVSHYLQALENGTLGLHDVVLAGSSKIAPLSENVCKQLLQRYLTSTTDISFSIVTVFLQVLSHQLLKLSHSQYFRVANLNGMLKNKEAVSSVRTTMVEALIEISREFACRSIHTCKSAQHITIDSKMKEGFLNKHTQAMLKRVDGMIRWNDSNHLLVVFHSQNIQTVTPLYRKLKDVSSHIQKLFHSQIGRELVDFDTLPQNALQDMLDKIVRTSSHKPSKNLEEMCKRYALTPDNLLKMVLIIMRIRSDIPVVLMGETGCGKTSLVRYLALTCDIEFEIFHLHAGITRENIIQKISSVNGKARKNRKKEFWLFLDEINTCNHLGLLNDVLCHRILCDQRLSQNLKCIAACNPYRLRDQSQILTSGLGSKVTFDQFSQLVYRVHPLPETMIDYVWDYGTLSHSDEVKYINQMVNNTFLNMPTNSAKAKLVPILSASQEFIRDIEINKWSVSLRDINRCCHLITWFYKTLKEKAEYPRKSNKMLITNDEYVYRAVVLSLAHCYEVRLQSSSTRKDYWKCVSSKLYGDQKHVNYITNDIVRSEQMDILDRMTIGVGIAKNTALRENVFVIFVCILNRIPIFVVGKPGCSKSLSMQLIKSNLRGWDSDDPYFQTLPQVYVVSYQGSESSTSEGIIKIFQKAERYRQQQKKHENILPVVLLDEIGLAEVSKYNPLKVLHSLLEPQTGTFPEVAVVGISNWSLDPAKMNRAIHLSRPDLDKDELYDTGYSISTVNLADNQIIEGYEYLSQQIVSDQTLHAISSAYFEYHENPSIEHFHGLRDYYSVVKYISNELLKRESTGQIQDELDVIQLGLLRNFGGLPATMNKVVEIFLKHLACSFKPKIGIGSLIHDNIADKNARHLLLISNGDSIIGEIGSILGNLNREYRVFYGSNFEEDQKEEYSYRVLSSIIYCMDHGIVLILKDLDEIYGSLYDMLNQNYTTVGKKKHCRIALGAHSNPMCHVHDTFRCIVLVEENRLDYSDPPFFNRFEKQRLHFQDLLNDHEKKITDVLEDWTVKFITMEQEVDTKIQVSSGFLGYHEETIPSLVKSERSQHPKYTDSQIIESCKAKLLLTCTPDAVLRLPCSSLSVNINENTEEVSSSYFDLPINDGFQEALNFILQKENAQTNMKFVCFTRSNIHTDIKNIAGNKTSVQIESVGTFKSERQMTAKIETYFNDKKKQLLVIQCSLTSDIEHLLLAKLQVENKRNQYLGMKTKKEKNPPKHVCFLLHLDKRESNENVRSQWQFNYSDGWHLFTVDVLDYGETALLMNDTSPSRIKSLLNQSPSALLRSKFQPIEVCIKQNLMWAFNCLFYSSHRRHPDSMKQIIDQVIQRPDIIMSMADLILKEIKSKEDENVVTILNPEHWQVKVACNVQLLLEGCSMIEAWRRHLDGLVKSPLSRLVWLIENTGTWDCIVSLDPNSWMSEFWMRQLEKCMENVAMKKISMNQQGMMSMDIDNPPLGLKFPFSRVFLIKIKEMLNVIRELDVEDISELTKEEFSPLIMKYLNLVESKFIDEFCSTESTTQIEEMWPIIVDDFCNEFSWFGDINLPEKLRIVICNGFLRTRISKLGNIPHVAMMTAYSLVYAFESSRIWTLLKLISICEDTVVDDIQKAMEEKETIPGSDKMPVANGTLQDQAENDMCYIEDIITNIVTESVVPFESTIQHYGGLQNWFENASAVLSYCSRLGAQCDTIHFIRFCFDLVSILTEESIVVAFTKYASEGNCIQLDSEKAFEYLFGLCSHKKETLGADNCQKLVCLYFARCLEYNPETALLGNMLDCVCQNRLPNGNLDYLGPFIQCVLYDVDEKFEQNEITIVDLSDTSWYSNLLNEVHEQLCNVDQHNSFFVMCTDIVLKKLNALTAIGNLKINQLKSEFGTFNTLINMYVGGKVKGLQSVFCLAYTKLYIQSVAVCVQNSVEKQFYGTLQEIDSCMSLLSKDDKMPKFRLSFIRLIRKGTMIDIQDKCKDLEDALPGIRSVSWPDNDVSNGIGFNVLSLSTDYATCVDAINKFPEEKLLQDVLKKAMSNKESMKGFIGALASRFFWTKCVTDQRKDTERNLTTCLEKKLASFDAPRKKAMLCILGKENFLSESMNISTQHSYEEYLQASLLVHIMVTVLCDVNTKEKAKAASNVNLFAKCILQVEDVRKYICPRVHHHDTRKTSSVKVFKCKCQHQLLSKNVLEFCPVCKSDKVSMTDISQGKGTTPIMKLTLQDALTEDCESLSITESVMKLLIEGAIIVGYSLNLQKPTWLNANMHQLLLQNFHNGWSFLQKKMCAQPQSFTMILHKLIHDHEHLFREDMKFENDEPSHGYTNDFARIIQKEVVSSSYLMTDFKRQVFHRSGSTEELVEQLYGLDCSIETRHVSTPTIDHMLTMVQLHCEFEDTTFPFLKLLQEWQDRLSLLECLMPILQWQLKIHQLVNHKYTRPECSSFDFHRFIYEENSKIKDELALLYNAFINSLECLRNLKFQMLCEEIGFKFVAPDIHYKTSLNGCVIENDQHWVAQMIKALVWIQNSFLTESAQLSLQNHQTLRFLSQKGVVSTPCTSVQQITEPDVVNFQWSKKLLRFSQNDIDLNSGESILYDFQEIEKELANKLLLGKPLLETPSHLFKTIYRNEMFHWCSHIFTDITEAIQQEDITCDMQNSMIQGIHENQESGRSTLDFLEIIIAMLYKTGGNTQDTILSYAERWKISVILIKSKTMLTQLKNYLRLCHVVSLYEFLEEKLSYIAIDAIPKDYCTPIPETVRTDLLGFIEKGYVEVNSFLIALKRLISRYLCSSNYGQVFIPPASAMTVLICDQPLWPTGISKHNFVKQSHDGPPVKLDDVFPKSALMEHVSGVYKLVTEFIQNMEKEQCIIITKKPATVRNRRGKRNFFET